MKTIRSMVLVSSDPDSMQKGSGDVLRRFQEEIRSSGLSEEVALNTIYDVGYRNDLPLVIIYPDATVYGPVRPEDVHVLVDEHLLKGQISKNLIGMLREPDGEIAWLRNRRNTLPVERRIVLARCGVIDPESLDDYILHDGYQALGKALTAMTPFEVIEEVNKSGLQGRGGAAFATGLKWSYVSAASGEPKYVICNADESEPGTFKDRVIMEGDPFSILEAVTIAGYAVGAHEAFIYIRGEYHHAFQRLNNAIQQAKLYGLLGENIMGSKFNFEIHLHAGAGAYVCGEETALIESIEGKRGQPRGRPPYPPTFGLWGKPTLVNNVETLASIPAIIRNSADWYRQFGRGGSIGTKVFTILGNVNAPGLIEASFGITLREIINIYGKGVAEGQKLKLVQIGGSTGSIIPPALLDLPLDYFSCREAGATLGSGALLICDERTCVVDLAKTLMHFFRFESCSKCMPCRTGTQYTYEILNGISVGDATDSDLDMLLKLTTDMEKTTNCGLGQVALVPVRDILKYFREEVEAHFHDRVCPSGVCHMKELAPIGDLV